MRVGRREQLVIASHNAGKLVEIAALLAPFGIDELGAAALGLPEPEETGDISRATPRSRRRPPPRRADCPRSPTIRGWSCRRSAARPASIRRAGPAQTRISALRWRASSAS